MTRSQLERIARIHNQLQTLAGEVISEGDRRVVEGARAQLAALLPGDALDRYGLIDPRWRGDEAEAEDLLAAFDRGQGRSHE